MVETYLLEYLAAFEKAGTLSDAAKILNLSQSALSRSMQRLEQIIGVKLFERGKNSIALNANGKLAAEYARRILPQIQDAVEKVREFDRKNRTISVGCCAPVPLNEIIFLLSQIFPEVAISSELNHDEYLLQGLREDFFNLVVLHEKPADKFFAVECGREKLFLCVPLNHEFADKAGIYLEELNGEKVLLYSKIGFWFNLCREKAPNARFLLQNDRQVFTDLTEAAAFLSFTTDVLLAAGYAQKNCLYKPILNPDADVIYYCACKPNQKARFADLFSALAAKNFAQNTARFLF